MGLCASDTHSRTSVVSVRPRRLTDAFSQPVSHSIHATSSARPPPSAAAAEAAAAVRGRVDMEATMMTTQHHQRLLGHRQPQLQGRRNVPPHRPTLTFTHHCVCHIIIN
eukprot:GHVU01087102.1.p1 GENE.GHVU01087102.1~~GHVU01087102.1.p1  ORF type:complete len:109 (+),score=12.86 GHVU01087102.1:392-718(+)